MTARKRIRKETAPASEEHLAFYRYVRVSPFKCRLVVDMIRGKPLDFAINVAGKDCHRGAYYVHKLLLSAAAGAREKNFPSKLLVSTAKVDDGPRIKRFKPRSRGRAYPLLLRSCHISIGLKPAER